ncbi:MAG: 50S ribosomal protein L15 [SAR202 cluster bacterium]|uniref:Large ribosomal subunit protein uL15/eL18 domain-containing protein n=1 Tax=marine metagenome TaxID=408172 RepID=A0A381PDT8_9ZZZZ|nr:50S ribosomal protein L15 [Dehalococcoidia bacterium]MCH2502237.1 50S ribosomal protein L15 [Dehalococcoidia bacterium]MEC9290607.1 50S ribosomal protein L15 [Chloroflexota bacterium]MED5588630.1 50S ribosomal protein L15 [Chloroflexota bacterium]MQG14055.1 50S ribosomal protein L15 [SAR202 cluster bacterium]|tara:strand:+ start:271 stop:720 length:450 start_codon:yes stop_codon:yes gene_type:complete
MMEHLLAPSKGARKNRKRIGRGDAAGQGSTAGRGNKGQKSRSGGGPPVWFEGGQLPLIKGLPMKRGFHNRFKTYYSLIKVETLESFDAGDRITPELLLEKGYLRNLNLPVKIVGDGEISKPVTVVAAKFTQSARAKIEAAKGTAEEIAA